MFGAVEGLLMFLCGSGEYDELTLAEILSTLAKVITALCRQGNKSQQVTQEVGAVICNLYEIQSKPTLLCHSERQTLHSSDRIRSRFMIHVIQGKHIPGLYDLHSLYIVLPYDLYDLYDLAHISWVGSVLQRSCASYHIDSYSV